MTTAPIRRIGRFLASPRLATVLLLFLAGWAIGASFIPQSTASADAVAAWRATNPGLVPFVDTFGLHDAFMSPLFIAPGLFLALCTAVCAWQRTGVARRRARILRSAEEATGSTVSVPVELDVPIAQDLGEARALEVVAETLKRLGIPTSQRGSTLVSGSPWWTVWGTAIFHWALVAVIVLIAVGGLVRAEGQMGVGVGQVRPDQPESYGQFTAGPWYRLRSVDRSIRVDGFELDYEAGGVRRGPTPTVAVLNGDGEVLESRIVYPNHILRHGSLSIYPVDYGLSASVVMIDDSGAAGEQAVHLLDFDGTSPDG
ncbi:MAG: cytochrome c biogenesis protein ResB, partial [Coriobacteriia bacterium]|nr:cytochrome c biogenesis protein ResB [Coriobacteriia bacterium]